MASSPASVISIALPADERGDGGAGGSTSSKPPVIDLANNRLRLNFILPIRLLLHCSKFRGQAGLHLCHGYRKAGLRRLLDLESPQSVRVRPRKTEAENGGGYGGTAVGRD